MIIDVDIIQLLIKQEVQQWDITINKKKSVIDISVALLLKIDNIFYFCEISIIVNTTYFQF